MYVPVLCIYKHVDVLNEKKNIRTINDKLRERERERDLLVNFDYVFAQGPFDI